jgi:hypothetical protein
VNRFGVSAVPSPRLNFIWKLRRDKRKNILKYFVDPVVVEFVQQLELVFRKFDAAVIFDSPHQDDRQTAVELRPLDGS